MADTQKETDKHTDKRRHRKRNIWTEREIYRDAYRQVNTLDEEKGRRMDRYTDKQADRTNAQAQTDRDWFRQADQ